MNNWIEVEFKVERGEDRCCRTVCDAKGSKYRLLRGRNPRSTCISRIEGLRIMFLGVSFLGVSDYGWILILQIIMRLIIICKININFPTLKPLV